MWTSLQFQNCTPVTSICSSINVQLCLGCDLHLWIAVWVSFDVCKLYTFCVTLWHTLASDYTGTWLYLMWLILLQSLTLVHAAFCLEIVARLSGLDFWCDDLKLVCNLHMTWKLCVSFMYLVFGVFSEVKGRRGRDKTWCSLQWVSYREDKTHYTILYFSYKHLLTDIYMNKILFHS